MMRYVARVGKCLTHFEVIDSLGGLLILLSLFAVGGSSSVAAPTSFSWNTLNGQFNDSANWVQTGPIDLDGLPDANDIVTFRRGNIATYTVTFPGTGLGNGSPVNYVTDQLRVGNNNVSFVDGNSTVRPFPSVPSTYTVDNPTTTESGRGIIVGETASDTAAVLTTRLATLSATAATIGDPAGSNGTLNVSAGTFNVTGSDAANLELIVGRNGSGGINVTGGADVNVAQDTALGENAGSSGSATISGTGSTWTNGGDLFVGRDGTGTMNVNAAGQVNSASCYIGFSSSSTSMSTVAGGGSMWTIANQLSIGYAGSGALAITDGAKVSSSSGTIGSLAGSTGSVTVDGTGSIWNNAVSLIVGNTGSGTLEITNGGAVSNSSSTGVIANAVDSTGFATVDGAGSTWTIGSDLYVGNAGTGTLNIKGGGHVSSTARGKIGSLSGSMGTANVDGAGSTWAIVSDLDVGDAGAGTLNITGGGQVSAFSTFVGNSSGSTGSVTVSGANSFIDAGVLNVGYDGNGTFTLSDEAKAVCATLLVGQRSASGKVDISDGAQLSGLECFIGGAEPGAIGSVTVDGSSESGQSLLIVRAQLRVGDHGGSGALYISAGGHVQLLPVTDILVTAQTTIGAGGVGLVTVAGLGSALVTSGSLMVTPAGALHISDHAGVEVHRVSVLSGDLLGITNIDGILIVEGQASFLSEDGLHIDRGNMQITGGATVFSGGATIGISGGGGSAIVDGVGSTWTSGNLQVGTVGSGSLAISHGATVAGGVAGANLTVGSQGELHGDGTLVLNVQNGGLVSPGNSPGALTITGNYTQTSAGKLLIELAGTTPGTQYDQLLVSGTIALDGTLKVSLIGFSPTAGNSFHILDFAGRTGTFAMLQLPGGGLTWDTSQLYTMGVLTVGGVLGDYNHNGVVDAADYIVWRKTLGQTGNGLAADGNGNGVIDAGDFDFWRSHFGQTASGGSAASVSAAIPEPSTLALLIVGILAMGSRRRVEVS